MTTLHTSMQPQVADRVALNLSQRWDGLQPNCASNKSLSTLTPELQLVVSTGKKGEQCFCRSGSCYSIGPMLHQSRLKYVTV